MGTSVATDNRGAFWAVTCTTGARPRRPQVRPFGGLEPRDRTRLRRLPRHPGPPPSFYLRPGLLPPGDDLLLAALGGAPSGHLHAPAQAVQQQVQPGQGVVHAEPGTHDLGDAGQRPGLIGPASSSTCSSSSWARLSRQRAPPGPLEASAGRPPAASARRQRLADIRVTRKRPATSRSVAPSSIHSAASSRSCSRRAQSSAVSPPPWEYLMVLA